MWDSKWKTSFTFTVSVTVNEKQVFKTTEETLMNHARWTLFECDAVMFQWKVLFWSRGIRASRGWSEVFSISSPCLWLNQTQTECGGWRGAANRLLLTHCVPELVHVSRNPHLTCVKSITQTWHCLRRNLTQRKKHGWGKVTQHSDWIDHD